MVMMGKEIQSLVLIMKLVLWHKAPKTSYLKTKYTFNFVNIFPTHHDQNTILTLCMYIGSFEVLAEVLAEFF